MTAKQLEARKAAGKRNNPRGKARQSTYIAVGFYGCHVLDKVIVVATKAKRFSRPNHAVVKCECGGQHEVGTFLWRQAEPQDMDKVLTWL